MRDFDQLPSFERIEARSFSQGELEILSQRSEGTMRADRAPVLAGEKREACPVYPDRPNGGEAYGADERALSPIGEENRQDSTKAAHFDVTWAQPSHLPVLPGCGASFSSVVTVDWSCATFDPFR
ncbi:MAG TPA: hypothetical protein VK969_09845 [Acidimicrobiia bacterium]|nr:hypothetical protein [Acidimicrobiia bacterium]